jgi:hypothetical protein
MRLFPALPGAIGLGLVMTCAPAAAQQAQLVEQLKAMRQQLDQQRVRIDALERQLGTQLGTPPPARLDNLRGTGTTVDAAPPPGAVGPAPQAAARAPEVAPIFESSWSNRRSSTATRPATAWRWSATR